MLYKEYRNEIPTNTLQTWARSLLEAADWRFIGHTGDPGEPLRHWAAYPELKGVVKQLWDFVNTSLIEDGFTLKPERVILNLYNHGDSSWLHKDSESSEDYTVIVFLNEHWNINWGGDFVLVEDNEIIKSFAATPGKFVCFRSNLLHGARPVSREAPYPRFGVAFQAKGLHNGTIKNLSRIQSRTL